MRASLVALLFAVVAVASASKTPTTRSAITANLNDYIDSIVSNLQVFLVEHEYDSVALPNNTQSFSTTPLWITYSGRLSLFDGILQDLDTVRRYGDIELSYENKVLTISANVGIDTLTFNYNYEAKLIGFLSANGRAVGAAKAIDAGGAMTVDFNTYTLALESFAVNRIESLSVKLRGNALVDWFSNAIISLIVSIAKNDIVNTIETEVTSTVETYLETLNAAIAPSSFSS